MQKRNQLSIPDFVEIQRHNFHEFLQYGIIHELSSREIISHETTGILLKLYPEYYQFCRSETNIKTAITNGRTYGCRFYVPGELIDRKNNKTTFQWILLGTIPLMSRRGHFILNGSPRVIINQLVRSPGIYYTELLDRKSRRTVYADLISQRGTWLRFEMDAEGMAYIRMKRTPKIPFLLVLQAMGLNTTTLIQKFFHLDWFKNQYNQGYEFHLIDELEKNYQKTGKAYSIQEWALISVYAMTHPKREFLEITPELGRRFLFRKFLNPKLYDLGLLGRQRLNQRFNLNISLDHRVLTIDDLLKIFELLGKIYHENAEIDDIDHLKNRRLRASGELIQNQFTIGLTRFEKVIRERLRRPNENLTLSTLITTKPMNAAFREFFGSSQLSQFLDQTNPLAEITHKRRFTSLGPSGVSRETAGMAIRGIHPTHYGRICPIETPEGQNAGLVNSPGALTRLNKNGYLETPFKKLFKGQIQPDVFYLTADQEEQYIVAPGDLYYDNLLFLDNKNFPVRRGQIFDHVASESIDFMAISSLQMISVAASLIPFFEHDDANRALMGSNMQRQAVPLLKPEKPIVGTGFETRIVCDSGHTICAKHSGYVTYVSCKEIRIYSLISKRNTLKNFGYLARNEISHFETITYKLESISRSNQDTYQFEKPVVHEGQWIEQGEIIADGSASAGGELALGKNILIGYLPWEGYNFEDAILISENLVNHDLYTSLHVEKYDLEIKETRYGEETLTSSIPDLSIEMEKLLDSQGIIKLGSWVKEGDILVGKITPINKKPLSPHERLLYDIVGKNVQDVKDSSLRVPKGLIARVVKIRIFDENDICYEKTLKKNSLSNLSESKRLSKKIMKPLNFSEMKNFSRVSQKYRKRFFQKTLLKSLDKYSQHISSNSSIVSSIKNFKSLHLLAESFCDTPNHTTNSNITDEIKVTQMIIPSVADTTILQQKNMFPNQPQTKQKQNSDSQSLNPIKKIKRVQIFLAEKRRIQVGDKVAGRHGNKGIISRILPQSDMPFLPDGTPLDLVLNPLGVPSRMNVGQIYECLLGFAGSFLGENYKILPFDESVGAHTSRSIVYEKLYNARLKTGSKWLFNPNYPGKVKLFDGRTGDPFDQRVTVGYSYILKLVHQVDEKIHARSTGPYSLVTQQPLRGRSKHGGQRLGEMEVWALEGFGAAYTLQELLTVKSDDMKGRHQVMNAILTNMPMQLGTPESFKVLVRELQSLCLDIGVFAITDKGYRRPIDILRLP